MALLTALAAALALARFLYVPWLRRCAMVVAEIVACGLAVVVAVYAGLLLQTLSGVRLWSSPWVPALFALSAASCGCALLMAGALFVEGDGSVRKAVRSAARVDVVVIVAEAVAAAGLLAFALGSDHAGVRASATSLMHGPAALPWWAAFVACGLAAALAVEVGCLGSRARGSSRSAAKAVAKGVSRLRPWLLRLPSCSWVLWACAPRWWRPVPSVPWSCRKRKPPLPYLPKTRRRRACVPRLPQRKAGEKAPQREERT